MTIKNADQVTILLVHGAWHGAWCWAPLQAELDARGIPSLAIDLPGHGASTLPLTDMYGDAQHVADVASNVGGRVALVGHSYGGAVISEAAYLLKNTSHVTVEHLFYVAAFCLPQGESIADFNGRHAEEPNKLSEAVFDLGDGNLGLHPALAIEALYQCTPADIAKAASLRLSPQPLMTVLQPLNDEPWRNIPSTYVLCSQDNGIPASQQREMSDRCAQVVTIDTDHSPFASTPVALADALSISSR